jgi:hypothetical protein
MVSPGSQMRPRSSRIVYYFSGDILFVMNVVIGSSELDLMLQ